MVVFSLKFFLIILCKKCEIGVFIIVIVSVWEIGFIMISYIFVLLWMLGIFF